VANLVPLRLVAVLACLLHFYLYLLIHLELVILWLVEQAAALPFALTSACGTD